MNLKQRSNKPFRADDLSRMDLSNGNCPSMLSSFFIIRFGFSIHNCSGLKNIVNNIFYITNNFELTFIIWYKYFNIKLTINRYDLMMKTSHFAKHIYIKTSNATSHLILGTVTYKDLRSNLKNFTTLCNKSICLVL